MFGPNSPLPTETLNRVTSEDPTWDSISAGIGYPIRTLTSSGSGAASTVMYIDSVTCALTINVRFSITDANRDTPADDGTVTYARDRAGGL